MGSAAPATQREASPEPELVSDPVPEPDRRGVAGYVSADSAKEPSAERRPEAAVVPVPSTQPAEISAPQPQLEKLQAAVLQALTDGNQRILVSMLQAGEWSVQGNELVIKVSESQTVVVMSLGPDGKRLAIASASGVLGRAVKLKIVPGATVAPQENKRNGGAPTAGGPGGRGRAEQDPVVQRMREKFGAQIRTVIDYKEKR